MLCTINLIKQPLKNIAVDGHYIFYDKLFLSTVIKAIQNRLNP